MYQLDWVTRFRLNIGKPAVPIRPVVWRLGYTSLLTDVSSEMVNSLLPVYLVLHLHLGTLQYGAIDGLYNGAALALLGLAGGLIADRTRRPKEVAAVGYGLSAACKPLLLLVGAAWSLIAAVIAIDRCGKGIRTAPRDAIISLNTPDESLASAFAVHRALDAGGALLGPIVAFVLLSLFPARFDTIWLTSFVFGFLGLAVLWLFVENPDSAHSSVRHAFSWRQIFAATAGRGFWPIAAAGFLLSAMTVSDGFFYLLLQRRAELNVGFFPLFYVVTACIYMLLSIPIGRVADRYGRLPVLISGYLVVVAIYVVLLGVSVSGVYLCGLCLLLLGIHYAATEGVLVAMASALLPSEYRSSALAILATMVSLGRFSSSIVFGWIWQSFNARAAIEVLALGLAATILVAVTWLRRSGDARFAR
jgi:MFS family permease